MQAALFSEVQKQDNPGCRHNGATELSLRRFVDKLQVLKSSYILGLNK